MYNFASCLAITVICFGIAEAIKKTETVADKWIPAIVLGLGLILGIVAFLIGMASFPAQDIITAAAVGIYSGGMAIGAYQLGKQLRKDE